MPLLRTLCNIVSRIKKGKIPNVWHWRATVLLIFYRIVPKGAPYHRGMDGIDLLRRDALLKRNAAILRAKREYHAALKEINKLRVKLRIRPAGRPRKATEDPSLKPTTVARDILLEGKVMTITELTIEAQRRGFRSSDDPRAVAHAIRNGLRYYRRHFKVEAGRWSLVG